MPQIHPHAVALYVQLFGTAMFCVVFLYLRRESGIVYFGYWGLAWALETIALTCSLLYFRGVPGPWLFGWAFLELGFCLALVAAANAETVRRPSGPRRWRFSLALAALLGILCWLAVRASFAGYHALHSLVLAAFYLYTFFLAPGITGLGRRMFRIALCGLALTSLHGAVVFFHVQLTGRVPHWAAFFRYHDLFDFGLQTILAFAAMAMWVGHLTFRLESVKEELERLRIDTTQAIDMDQLTGLLNQTALSRQLTGEVLVSGTVAVCDLDNFKLVNDRYGHLVGDELVRNIGHLIRASIREQDRAFRWGGDEFVILFCDATPSMVSARMAQIEERLGNFQVRGYGVLPIGMSWGVAEGVKRPFIEVLEEADQRMYESKRARQRAATEGAHS